MLQAHAIILHFIEHIIKAIKIHSIAMNHKTEIYYRTFLAFFLCFLISQLELISMIVDT